MVARAAGRCGGLAAPGTPPASALCLRNSGMVCLLARLGWAQMSRTDPATRAQRPDASDPPQRPATLLPRSRPRLQKPSEMGRFQTGFSAANLRTASVTLARSPPPSPRRKPGSRRIEKCSIWGVLGVVSWQVPRAFGCEVTAARSLRNLPRQFVRAPRRSRSLPP